MATDLTDWNADISFHINNVPEPAVQLAVRKAAIKFCEKTHLWKQDLSRIDVEEDTQDYTLTDPDNSKIICVPEKGVKYKQDGQDDDQFVSLDPTSETQNDIFDSGNWKYATGPTPSEYWVDNVDKQLHLKPVPTADSSEGLLVTVVLKPSDTCTTVPDFIYDDWKDTILQGSLYELYSRKSAPWYDPNLAVYHDSEFKRMCNNAKFNKITGATNKPMRVRMRNFV